MGLVTVWPNDTLIHARVEYHAGDSFETNKGHADELAARGLLFDGKPSQADLDGVADEPPVDPADDPYATIAEGLTVKDYEAGNARQIASLVAQAPLEIAEAVLAYEQAHEKRKTVTDAAEARVAELKAAAEAEQANGDTPPAA